MSDLDCYYQVLQLEPGASFQEVDQAYSDLAQAWQPDRFSNDPRLQEKARQKLREIERAYERLRSPVRSSRPRKTNPNWPTSGERESDEQSGPGAEDSKSNGKLNQDSPGSVPSIGLEATRLGMSQSELDELVAERLVDMTEAETTTLQIPGHLWPKERGPQGNWLNELFSAEGRIGLQFL
jgi:curved DNA-binding protein CbpA